MLKGENLIDYANLFSFSKYGKKNDKLILKHFQSQEFRLKNVVKIKSYFIKQIGQNE